MSLTAVSFWLRFLPPAFDFCFSCASFTSSDFPSRQRYTAQTGPVEPVGHFRKHAEPADFDEHPHDCPWKNEDRMDRNRRNGFQHGRSPDDRWISGDGLQSKQTE